MADLGSRAALKAIFETGDPLNQTAFTDLIDSLALKSEAAGTHPWVGKKITCLGSSITNQGFYTTPLAALSGAAVIDLSSSGGSLSSSASAGPQAIYNTISGIPADTDLVIMEVSPNDFRSNATLGTIADTTVATYYGAVFKTIEQIVALDSSRVVVFVLPYGNTDTAFAGSWNTNNSNGNSFLQFRQAVVEQCNRAGIPYFDPASWGIGGQTSARNTPDGIHLGTIGGKRYSEGLWSDLRSVPYRGWGLRTATQADVSGYNTTATYSTANGGSITHSGAVVGTYAITWMASGNNNAAEWTKGASAWVMFGEGSSGPSGIGDLIANPIGFAGRVLAGDITLGALSPTIPVNESATKFRAARVGNLLYIDQLVGTSWSPIINGGDILTAYSAAIAGYRETAKIGILTIGTVTNYRTGVFTP